MRRPYLSGGLILLGIVLATVSLVPPASAQEASGCRIAAQIQYQECDEDTVTVVAPPDPPGPPHPQTAPSLGTASPGAVSPGAANP
jgi:hypothetical protein